MQALIAAGARVSDDHIEGWSALDSAVQSRQPAAIRLLCEAKPPIPVIHKALRAAALQPVEIRKAFGAYYELNLQLEAAVDADDDAAVRTLLARGADPEWGKPQVSAVAAAEGKVKALRALLAGGASVDRGDAQLRRRPLNAGVENELNEYWSRTGSSSRLRAVLTRIQRAASSLPAGRRRERILAATTWMLKRANGYDQVSEEYLRELDGCAVLLEEAARGRIPERQLDAVLTDVAEELSLKTEHCRKLGIGMGGTIRVLVTTRREGQPVNNWQVLYLPKIFEHASGVSPRVVPSWTSPARETVEPGRYLLWARDPVTGKAGRPETVRLSGEQEIRVDLAVP
jgi:hypothetical protein